MSSKSKSYSQRRRDRTGPGRVPDQGRPMESIYAFLSTVDGVEAICAYETKNGWTPLICTLHSEIATLKPFVRTVASGTDLPVRLVRFERARVMETIEPDPELGAKGHFEMVGPTLYEEPEEPILLGREPGPADEMLGLSLSVADGKVVVGLASGTLLDKDVQFGIEPDVARQLAEELLFRASLIDGKEAVVTMISAGPGRPR